MGTNRITIWIVKKITMTVNLARYGFLVCSLFAAAQVSSPQASEGKKAPEDKQLTILFAGDIMQHGPQILAALNDSTHTYDYTSCFQYVLPIISQSDVAIANLEVTLAGEPYTGYPQFSAPDQLAVALKQAGFDILATANNHSCDRGDQGILRTIKVLDSLGIKHTGTFADSVDYHNSNPLLISQNDITVALLNYTYGTNGLTFKYPAMVNIIDEQKVIDDLRYSKTLNPDFIIVFFHWGNEYESYPTDQQQKLAQISRENGADAVIGSHPHVIQPAEYYPATDSTQRNRLIVYSLGNYVSNQRDRYKDGGCMVSFKLLKTWNRKTLTQPEYRLTWVYNPVVNNKKQYYLLPVNEFINDTTIDQNSRLQMNTFMNDSRLLLNNHPGAIPESTVITGGKF